MVRVQGIVRLLALAALAVAVRADDVSTQTGGDATCVAPEVLASYEAKIDLLETERAQWQSQLVAANGQWNKQKSELESKLETEQKSSKKSLAKSEKEAAASVAKLEKQLSESASQHKQSLQQLQTQVSTLEQTVEELKKQLAAQKEALGKREAEVSDAKAKLVKSQDQVKSLERDVASSRKRNEALRNELEKMDEKLTISALLSSYYDEGVVLAADAVEALRVQLESAQQGSAGVAQALEALETYKKQVSDVSSQLYAEHLAATLDPLIADLHRASQPYVKQYRPLVEAELARAQKLAVQNYKFALKRGKAVRADAIAVLKQNEGVAPYAQRIVDGSLFVLAAPIAFLLLRLVLSLTWFVIRTVLCILTLGFCCDRCARKRSKSKRKVSRKLAANGAPGSPTPTPSTVKTPASTNGKRSTGKKQK